MTDRELKWDEIPDDQKKLFEEAAFTEWDSWLNYKCVEVREFAE